MKLLSSIIVLFCALVIVSGARRPTYSVPERRSELTVNTGQTYPIPYQYQIIPSSEYAVTSYQPEEYSILDYILSPVTAIVSFGSTALSVAYWTIVNCSLVLLGMAIVIGFCGLTSYCNMTIEIPFSRELSIPYLDNIHYYFNEAYNKYHEMQGLSF